MYTLYLNCLFLCICVHSTKTLSLSLSVNFYYTLPLSHSCSNLNEGHMEYYLFVLAAFAIPTFFYSWFLTYYYLKHGGSYQGKSYVSALSFSPFFFSLSSSLLNCSFCFFIIPSLCIYRSLPYTTSLLHSRILSSISFFRPLLLLLTHSSHPIFFSLSLPPLLRSAALLSEDVVLTQRESLFTDGSVNHRRKEEREEKDKEEGEKVEREKKKDVVLHLI